jgi:hypothetical protein
MPSARAEFVGGTSARPPNQSSEGLPDAEGLDRGEAVCTSSWVLPPLREMLMNPVTKELRKYAAWELADTPKAAFERVKKILTTKPVLVYSDFSLPFGLVTDACKISLGACLMQDQGGGWRPIAYASKVNSDTKATTAPRS